MLHCWGVHNEDTVGKWTNHFWIYAVVQFGALPTCKIGKQSPITPPKLNIELEHDSFQKGSPFPVGNFQVPC